MVNSTRKHVRVKDLAANEYVYIPHYLTHDWEPGKYRAAVLVASGPSTRDVDYEYLKREDVFVCVVNNEVDRHPGISPNLWVYNDKGIGMRMAAEKLPAPRQDMRLLAPDGCAVVLPFRAGMSDDRLYDFFYHRQHLTELLEDPYKGEVFMEQTVGTAACHLMIHMGFKKIYLVGCDCSGGYHVEENPKRAPVRNEKSKYEKMVANWATFHEKIVKVSHPDVTIINTSDYSAIETFKKGEFE